MRCTLRVEVPVAYISATADDRAVDALVALDHVLGEEAPTSASVSSS